MPSRSSQMPDGGVTPTYGSNLLLDSFDFDTDYGSGPESARKDPRLPRSTNGLSALPDGMVVAAEEPLEDGLIEAGDSAGVGDLGGMVREAAHLTDLSWLEDAEQDPNRLPKSPHSNMIAELEEAWGRRTDGRTLSPNNGDRRNPTVYEPSGPASGLPNGEVLRAVVASAMRRSAYGEPLDRIAAEAGAQLGPALKNMNATPLLRATAAALRAVRAEHGVAGRLYLRPDAFPGLLTGKWDGEIRHKCAEARYWLVPRGSKLAAYDRYLGKTVVTEIPWGAALAAYQPRFERAGIRVAAEGTPRDRLLAALRARPAKDSPRAAREAVEDPSLRVTAAEAWRALGAVELSRETPQRGPSRFATEAVERALTRWVKAGLLPEAEVQRLRALRLPPARVLRAASDLVVAAGYPAPISYRGVGEGVVSREVPSRDAVWASAQEESLRAEELRRARAEVERRREAGQLTAAEAKALLARGLTPAEMRRAAAVRAADTARPVPAPLPPEARPFTGPRYGEAPPAAPRTARDGAWAAAQEKVVREKAEASARADVQRWVKAGQLTAAQAACIEKSGLAPGEMRRVAAALVEKRAAASAAPAPARPVASYEGRVYTVHTPPPRPPLAPLPRAKRASAPAPGPSAQAPVYDAEEFGLTGGSSDLDFYASSSPASSVEVELGGLWFESDPPGGSE